MSVASSVNSETPLSEGLTPSQAKRKLNFSDATDLVEPDTVIFVELKKKPKPKKRKVIVAFPTKVLKRTRPGSYITSCRRTIGSAKSLLDKLKSKGNENLNRKNIMEILGELQEMEKRAATNYGMMRNLKVGEKVLEKKEATMQLLESVLQETQALLQDYQRKLKGARRRRSRLYNLRSL